MRRSLLVTFLLTSILVIAAWFWWRNQPSNVAVRFLDEFAEHLSVPVDAAPLARQTRAGGLVHYFADPTSLELAEVSQFQGSQPLADLQGYYAAALASGSLEVRFTEISGERSDGVLTGTCRVQAEYTRAGGAMETRDLRLRLRWDSEMKLTLVSDRPEL